MKCEDKKKILYLGHDPSRFPRKGSIFHFPIIKTEELFFKKSEIEEKFSRFRNCSHAIFTSRQAVFCTLGFLKKIEKIDWLKQKVLISIGRATTLSLKENGLSVQIEAKAATQEGVIETIKKLFIKKEDAFFYPHSELARPFLKEFLGTNKIAYYDLPLYTTLPNAAITPPSLDGFEEIVFTSPSTVDAFLKIYGTLPKNLKLSAIGPVTGEYLNRAR